MAEKETNEKLTKLQEQFESYQKKNDFDLSIMKIRNLKANENYIRDQVKKFFNDKSVDHFKIFIIYNKYFIESSQLLKKTGQQRAGNSYGVEWHNLQQKQYSNKLGVEALKATANIRAKNIAFQPMNNNNNNNNNKNNNNNNNNGNI